MISLILRQIPFLCSIFLLVSDASAQFAALQQRQDVVAMYLFNGQDEVLFRRQLEARSELRVSRIAELLKLDDKQKSKLDFAVRGDLNRFYRDMELVRLRTEGLDIQNQQEWQKAWEHLQPLYNKVMNEGVIGADSLMEKVLSATLTTEQTEIYEEHLRKRRQAELRSMTHLALLEVEKSIPLLSSQREAIVALLEDVGYSGEVRRGMEAHFGFGMLSKLKEQDLMQILDQEQWKAFQKFKGNLQRLAFGGIAW